MLVKLGAQLGDTKLPDEFVQGGTFGGETEMDEETEMLIVKEVAVEEMRPNLTGHEGNSSDEDVGSEPEDTSDEEP